MGGTGFSAMSDHLNTVLDDIEIEELDELLSKLENDQAMHLDSTHGLLTALAVGPEMISPDEWLPLVLGSEPVLESSADAERLVLLLIRLYNSILHGLEHYAYDPIFAEEMSDEEGMDEEPVVDAGGWCEGFSLGIDLRAGAWEAQMQDDPHLLDLLAPIVSLGVDDGVFAEIADPDHPVLSQSEREELLQQLPNVLFNIKQYWENSERSDAPPPGTHYH
jgi:uncharacterized protein